VTIDLHMHVDNVPGLGWTMTPELCVARMDEAGIDRAAIMTITDAPIVRAACTCWSRRSEHGRRRIWLMPLWPTAQRGRPLQTS
jgi:hypothetical protein